MAGWRPVDVKEDAMTRYEVRSQFGENVSNLRTGDFATREEALRDLEAAEEMRPDMKFKIVEVSA